MKSLQIVSRVSGDGILRLQIPTDMPNQELEVVVVLQPAAHKAGNMPEDGEWPPDFFERTAGIFQDDPLERGDQGSMKSGRC